MIVWILESAYFGVFKVFATVDAAKAFLQEGTLVPYGEGYAWRIDGRHSSVGMLLPHRVEG